MSQRQLGGPQAPWRASNAAERASEAAGRASEAAERASEAAERASVVTEKASEAAERADRITKVSGRASVGRSLGERNRNKNEDDGENGKTPSDGTIAHSTLRGPCPKDKAI